MAGIAAFGDRGLDDALGAILHIDAVARRRPAPWSQPSDGVRHYRLAFRQLHLSDRASATALAALAFAAVMGTGIVIRDHVPSAAIDDFRSWLTPAFRTLSPRPAPVAPMAFPVALPEVLPTALAVSPLTPSTDCSDQMVSVQSSSARGEGPPRSGSGGVALNEPCPSRTMPLRQPAAGSPLPPGEEGSKLSGRASESKAAFGRALPVRNADVRPIPAPGSPAAGPSRLIAPKPDTAPAIPLALGSDARVQPQSLAQPSPSDAVVEAERARRQRQAGLDAIRALRRQW